MSASGKNISTHGVDCAKIEPRILASIAFQIFLIREFEQALLMLSAEGCIHGPVHTSIGQEACAAGAMSALDKIDKISSTHRAHHHYLAKAISCYSFDPFQAVPQALIKEVTCLLGEVMGLSIGCCGGRGGSMHLRNEKIGVIGTDAIVAGGLPLATGAAYAAKYKKEPSVVMAFLGDGAVNQGAFHEALNLAGLWKLPVVYFIENNAYAVATAAKDSTVPADLALKGNAYGMRTRTINGMDPIAVMKAVREAKGYVLRGNGPVLIEAKCYRFFHHAGAMEGSAFGYRSKEEEQSWKEKDPYHVFPQKLSEQNILTLDQLSEIKAKAVQIVANAVDFCTVKTDGKHYVKADLWPAADSLTVGLRSDGHEFAGVSFCEIVDFSEFEKMTYVQAIAAVTERHLENDASVLTFGEEVASFGGGIYMIDPSSRIQDSLISNNTACAGGGGIAMQYGGTVSNCVITGNIVTNSTATGGGLNLDGLNGFFNVVNCVVTANKTVSHGGGICCQYGGFLKNCLIYCNTNQSGVGNGAGVLADNIASNKGYGAGAILNCTIVSNNGSALRSGLYVSGVTNLVKNCIVLDNVGDLYISTASDTNNCWNMCVGSVSVAGSPGALAPNQGNITNNPLFVSPTNRNYRLTANSPCINTGTNQSWMTNSYDLDGRARIRYGTVDMGAYELIYEGTIYKAW